MKYGLFGREEEKKRKPICEADKRYILRAQDNKCYDCKERFIGADRPHIHHRDGNPSNNKVSNLIYLCEKCHKEHTTKQAEKRAKDNKKDEENYGLFGSSKEIPSYFGKKGPKSYFDR